MAGLMNLGQGNRQLVPFPKESPNIPQKWRFVKRFLRICKIFLKEKFISQLLAWEGFAVRRAAEDGAHKKVSAGYCRHSPKPLRSDMGGYRWNSPNPIISGPWWSLGSCSTSRKRGAGLGTSWV